MCLYAMWGMVSNTTIKKMAAGTSRASSVFFARKKYVFVCLGPKHEDL